jgi:hypothetical protein
VQIDQAPPRAIASHIIQDEPLRVLPDMTGVMERENRAEMRAFQEAVLNMQDRRFTSRDCAAR